MTTRLREVLLIDDSVADNFLAARVVRAAGVAERVTALTGGAEALAYLGDDSAGDFPRPALVFLDINMPGMSGWEFLAAYRELPADQKAGVVVCMLTTSYADEDRRRAEEIGVVSDFFSKPLTRERLLEIVREHFADGAVGDAGPP